MSTSFLWTSADRPTVKVNTAAIASVFMVSSPCDSTLNRPPVTKAEFGRRNQRGVRAKPIAVPTRFRLARLLFKNSQGLVSCRSLQRYPPTGPNPGSELRRVEELTVLRASGRRNTFVHQRPAKIVRAGLQALLRELRSLLHPRGLNIRDPWIQH